MDDGFNTTVQVVAIVVTGAIFLTVLELVRRRRLVERYAILWMLAAAALLVLAVWRNALDILADLIGVADPVNAIFLVALGVIFLILLHFSVATSRLSEETKILAQEMGRLEQELRAARGEVPGPNGDGDRGARSAPDPEEGEGERPIGAQRPPE